MGSDWWFLIPVGLFAATAWLIERRQRYWQRQEAASRHARLMEEINRHPANGPQP